MGNIENHLIQIQETASILRQKWTTTSADIKATWIRCSIKLMQELLEVVELEAGTLNESENADGQRRPRRGGKSQRP